jgi:ketosteroid isomerase-like protein
MYIATFGETTDKGKYVTIWRKQPDGSWKVVEDMFNSDIPMLAAPNQP